MSFNDKLSLAYVRFIKLFRLTVINIFVSLFFKKKSNINKILINRDGAFGDSIVALPAISIIRQNYPDAQIDLLSINNNGISFKDLGIHEELINSLYNIHKEQRKEILKQLKEQGYDLFIQFPQNIGLYKSIRNIFLVRFYLRIPSAFGWDAGRVKSFMRLQKKHETIPTERHRFIYTLKENGLDGEIAYPLESLKPESNDICKLTDTQPIAFLIGGKLQAKKWPLNHWKSLSKLIGSEKNILILGGKDEFEEAEEINSKEKNIFNLCGKLTIPELRYVLEKCSIVISLDTGAMHLCDTTKTRQVVLFSTRDLSNKWFPNNKNTIVLEKVVNCSFCLKTDCSNNICMSNILPNEVFSVMKKQMAQDLYHSS
jgi:ADP-heptose:LPS heptosyltransferase